MALHRPCLDCGEPTTADRCPVHARAADRRHHRKEYDSPAWRRVRSRTLAAHRAQYGEWCPDDGGHATDAGNPLTVDHITPLAAGGELIAKGNLAVRCRVHNGAKGSKVGRWHRYDLPACTHDHEIEGTIPCATVEFL